MRSAKPTKALPQELVGHDADELIESAVGAELLADGGEPGSEQRLFAASE